MSVEDFSEKSEVVGQAKKSRRRDLATWTACAIWLIGLILSFLIPPSSIWIWVPDTFLLLGFFPFLWICPFSFVWILFGVLTTFIGWFLLLLLNISNAFMPSDTHAIKAHLKDFHPCWSWMIIGILVTAAGVVKMIVNIILFVVRKIKRA